LAAGGATEQLPGSAVGSLAHWQGGLTAEPSWLPSAACAAHRDMVRCPSGVGGLGALSASSVSVRACESARPVSGARVQRPRVRCPVSVSVSVSGVRCPVSVSGVRAEASAWTPTVVVGGARAAARFDCLADPEEAG
jgi:hypothetical protein